MKVLILSCNTGAGHNACAGAVQEALTDRGIPCDVRDGLGFVSGAVSRLISSGHVFLYRNMPGFYGKGYAQAEKRAKSADGDSMMFRFLSLGVKRLRAFITAGKYTHVICTHLFPAMMVTAMRRGDTPPVRAAFISTDYTASPGYESINVDWCFVPAPELIPEFEKPDMPVSRIVGCGIPVHRAFQTPADQEAARRILGIAPSCRHLLVMSGSMGCGPMKRILTQLRDKLDDDVEVSVICGTNRRLFRQLNRLLGQEPRFHIHARVDRISLLMDSADLYLTKPGGLSVSEALSKRLPMALYRTVDGCESYNMRYCVERGAARPAETVDEAVALCVGLLHDDAALKQMRKRMSGLFEPPAAEVVCDCLLTSGGNP